MLLLVSMLHIRVNMFSRIDNWLSLCSLILSVLLVYLEASRIHDMTWTSQGLVIGLSIFLSTLRDVVIVFTRSYGELGSVGARAVSLASLIGSINQFQLEYFLLNMSTPFLVIMSVFWLWDLFSAGVEPVGLGFGVSIVTMFTE